MHIPFIGMVKFKFLAHISLDHLADPFVSRLILPMCSFSAFAYCVNNRFVSITA